MNHIYNRVVRRLISPRASNTIVNQVLQRIRRRSYRITYTSKKGYYSQSGQDRFLNEVIFKARRNGTFIDIGAGDGVLLSNTYFFEKDLGWSGICVEPRATAFAKLTATRSCRCVQGCVTDSSGYSSFLEVADVPLLSGLLSKYDFRHVDRIRREVGAGGAKPVEIQVRCYTFDELMKICPLKPIDYLSIDTEGGELDLLRSIDFSGFDIRVVSVENAFASGQFESTLNDKGYDLIAVIGDDDIYVRRDVGTSSEAGRSFHEP